MLLLVYGISTSSGQAAPKKKREQRAKCKEQRAKSKEGDARSSKGVRACACGCVRACGCGCGCECSFCDCTPTTWLPSITVSRSHLASAFNGCHRRRTLPHTVTSSPALQPSTRSFSNTTHIDLMMCITGWCDRMKAIVMNLRAVWQFAVYARPMLAHARPMLAHARLMLAPGYCSHSKF